MLAEERVRESVDFDQIVEFDESGQVAAKEFLYRDLEALLEHHCDALCNQFGQIDRTAQYL